MSSFYEAMYNFGNDPIVEAGVLFFMMVFLIVFLEDSE